MEYYKKSDEKLTFYFHNNGTVNITEDNTEKFGSVLWKWKSDKKEYITLMNGTKYSDYHVLGLDKSILKITKSDLHAENKELLYFRLESDPEWRTDKDVEMMNGF